jgi:UDP-N-acetylmuramoyl-tripeptide--D-alanyl-D-alanine ligase
MTPMMSVQDAARSFSGAHLVGNGGIGFARVHTDTRSIAQGDLFVALKGEHFDANNMLLEAQQKGAAALVCHKHLDADRYPAGLPRIEVPDTKVALGELASAWRLKFQLPLIAVTGSNGKTTVTQMLAAILDAHCPNGAALATRGNLNNDIGVPLTLLRLRPQHTMAVVELGMNHPGEIAVLAAMARPTVALVNNAQREHLEFMHTLQAVAQENGSVIDALDAYGVAVFPSDDVFTPVWRKLARSRRAVTFSLTATHGPDQVGCLGAQWERGAWTVHACGMGSELHNVKNSLAAAACALAAGVPASAVQSGLHAFAPVKGRSRAIAVPARDHEITLVDDTYNANPDSVRAAIDVLSELPAPRVLVLGDMGEVGHEGPMFHAEAGRYALSRGIENLMALGELSRDAVREFPGARHFASVDELNAALCAQLPSINSVLVKGSRFMHMERVVSAVLAYFKEANGDSHGT